MSHPEAVQEAAEVTMETEVEAGASGYSVTGGGRQGIFVKQVLKDSSAAKLFSLREGDQLLSATIFFDDIKYEDALKILQYSEPYKIQFKIRRKLPATKSEESAVCAPPRGSKGREEHRDVAEECTETPTKTPEADGDRERLISKPRMSRGRRPQERLSWPKFQAIKGKRGPGPRRSHSSSEACEPGDVSPTRTDTEAQLPEEFLEQKAGPGRQRRRKFLNFRLKLGSGQDPSAAGHQGKGAQGRPHSPGVLGETGPWDKGPEDMGAAAGGKSEGRAQSQDAMSEPPAQQQTEPEPGLPTQILGNRTPGEGGGVAARGQGKTQQVKAQQRAAAHSDPRPGTDADPQMGWTEEQEEGQGLEVGTARLSLLDTGRPGSTQAHPPGTQVQVREVKAPKSGISKEKVPETEKGSKGLELRKDRGRTQVTAGKDRPAGTGPAAHGSGKEEGTEQTPETLQERAWTQEGKDRERRETKVKVPRFKMSSLGWPPTREAAASQSRAGREEQEDKRHKGQRENTGPHMLTTDTEEMLTQEGDAESLLIGTPEKDNATTEKHVKRGDREPEGRDSKFKMPKFKMPSFGVSTTSKGLDGSVEVTTPKVENKEAVASIQGDLKHPDVSIQLPTAEMDAGAVQVGVTLSEATLPEGEPPEIRATGLSTKGHFPKVQMPSIQMPKVELKGPQVDIMGPKMDGKSPKVEVSIPDVDVEIPSLQVDIQAPDTKLEGDVALPDKDVSTRDSKFKMPKFKMPSFGLSAPSKALDASLEVKAPKMEADVALPSIQGDLKGSDLSIQLPSTDMDAKTGQVGVTLPEATPPEDHLPEGPAAQTGLKGHLPKVQVPSITMPKVNLKGPQVHIKGPKLGMKGPKGEMSTPAVEVEMSSVEVDIQAPDAKLEGDVTLADKDVSTRDSKFKMPKFKMPSFGVSAPGKALDPSVEVMMPKVEAEEALPPIQGDRKSSDLSIQLPVADLGIRTGQAEVKISETTLPEGELPEDQTTGPSMKGHQKLQVPSIKMPKVELKGPQVDIKDHKVDMKGPKGEVSTPALDMEMPSVQVDMLATDAKLEGELALEEKDVVTKDSKFKMPKFRMPSFGVSAPAKALDVSIEGKMPRAEADQALPSIQGDLKSSDLTMQLPSADLDASTVQVGVTLPEATMPEGELPDVPVAGARMEGHLPKLQMPSIKMPRVDLKGPSMDIKGPKVAGKGPKVEVSIPEVDKELPSLQVDIQAPDTKLEGDGALADKDVSTRDSKFKMPKFKMPSFGLSVPGKALDASLEVKAPKMEADVALPSIQGDLKGSELSIQLPSTDMDAKTGQVGVTLPEATLPEDHLPEGPAAQTGLKGHLPKVQVPSITMPKVDLKGPQVHIKGPKLGMKGPKGEMSTPAVEVEMPSVQVDIQAPDDKLEGDVTLADKDVSTRESKFKMPKFKMPSFGVSAPDKALDPSVEVTVPKVEADVALLPIQGDLKSSDLTMQLPSAELHTSAVQVGVTLPEAIMPEGELPDVPVAGAKPEGHLPKVQMPSIKMPRVDLKGPSVDIKGPKMDGKGPKVEVSIPDVDKELPFLQVDIQAPDMKLEGDGALADKDVSTRDSKFKMPKFKMPSFGLSAPGKALDTSLEVKAPKMEADVALPSIQGDLKGSELSIQLPSTDMDAKTGQVGVMLPEATLPEDHLPEGPAAQTGLKGHLPKVQVPSITMPKVDLKGPQVHIKGPKLGMKGPKGELSTPAVEVEMSSVQVDIQAPDTKLEGDVTLADKDVTTRDSKFKMPKFKMPSFALTTPGKGLDGSIEVMTPKMEAGEAVPSIQGDLKHPDVSIQLPSADLDASTVQVGVKLSEATLPKGEPTEVRATGLGRKGHFPKVQMPSIQMPKVELKGPQVDIMGPKMDGKSPKVEVSIPDVDVEIPSVQVDVQAPDAKLEGDVALPDKDVSTRDSKFKMPKFKMPSFGLSAPGKALDASLEVKAPKMEADVALPSIQGDLKGSELSIQLPSTDMDAKTGQVGVMLPEATLPEGHLPEGPAAQTGLKGHLPKVQVPSITMPKVDLKGPQVHIKGPKLGMKGPKGEMSTPAVEVELPSMQVDIQAPDAKLEGDMALADKDVATRDSKFKMPKFKMPSFGLTAPGKGLDGSIEVMTPKMEAGEAVPSIQGDLKHPDVSIQLPTAEMDAGAVQVGVTLSEATLPEGEPPEVRATGLGRKGHFPKVQMPSIQMPKVELKGPQVDIKGPKLDGKSPKVEVSIPDVDMGIPSVQVDVQAPDAKLEGDMALADKDVSTRDSKFKMPKFKVPSFGVSAPGKVLDPSVEVTVPKVEAEVALPSIQGDLKSSDLTMQLPSADLDASAVQVGVTLAEATMPEGELPDVPVAGARLEGHLPKVQMPSIKMPRVDLKGPSVDIKDPKVARKGPKVEVSIPDVDKELPSLQVDIQAPDMKLEGDGALIDKDVSTRDSKFKMPKFKMPSLGLSVPGKALDASLEVRVPKMEADVALPSIQGDLKGSELSIQLPSTDMDAKTGQVGVTLPEATLPEGHLPEGPAAQTGLKGHLPKVQVPSITMPKVDLKGPQVHIKGPKLGMKGPKGELSTPAVEVEMSSVEVDIQAPDAKLEGDMTLADKDVSTRDSKFKMPKFKMPSFGLTAPGKGLDGSIEVTTPKMQAEVALPSIQGDLKSSDLTMQLPSADLDASTVQVGVTLPEATMPEGELPDVPVAGAKPEGHLPKVQMPSIKMPRVDLKGPSVDIKCPKMYGKGPKVEVSIPDVDKELPSLQVDIQAPDTKLEGDGALADKDVSTRDSKFKMPKFKMPSFGLSVPGKALDASLEVKAPKMEADVALPSIQGDLKGSDLSIQLPSTDMDAKTGQVGVTLPEATLPEDHLPEGPAAQTGLKGHLPKVQVPSITMPKVDLKGPQVHIKGPKLGMKGPKGEMSTPAVEVEMPSVQVDIQAPDAKLEGDVTLADKDVSTRDSKFKMPKFKMPSFGLTTPGKGLDGSIEVMTPKMEAGEAVPSIQGDLKHPDVSIQLPTAEMDAGAVQVGVTLSEATLPEGEPPEVRATGFGRKGHFPKVQMPSIQMPKVELKGPQVDIKGPKLDGKSPKVEVSIPDVDMGIPSVQVDVQAPDAKLEGDMALADKDVSTRDSKFKMPKFKVPSFGVSAPGKVLDPSVEVTVLKVEAEVALPSIQGDLKSSDLTMQLPSADLDASAVQVGVTLAEATMPEGELPDVPVAGAKPEGHLSKVQMPSIKMPRVDLKGPSVDIKSPKMDGKGPKVEVSISDMDKELPSLQVDIQAPDMKLEGDRALAEKDVSTRDSKFKMPKFKMPSFDLSVPGKALDASLEVKAPKMEADVALPSIQGDLKGSDLSIQLPSTDMDAKTGQVGVTLPEATLPEGHLPEGPAAQTGLKGHLPKVQMPSITMPKVDLKGPQVHIKGPNLGMKGPKCEMGTPAVEVEMPSVQVDIQAPDAKLEGDMALADKDVSTRDSKFKMPKFKVPSFGVSAPGKALDPSVEVTVPKVAAEVVLPSIQGDLKSSDLTMQLPSADVDASAVQVGVTLAEATMPEGELLDVHVAGARLEGHLSKVQMPSIKMPRVDLKGPSVDIKGPKVARKGPKVEVSIPDVDKELPSLQVDIQAPDMKLEGDGALADKDVSTRDSKFKMPKFKMPSFGLSVPGKALDASLEVKAPKMEAGEAVPSIQGELKHPDVSIQLPTAEMDTGTVQVGIMLSEATLPEGELPEVRATGLGRKGHFPKVQMPSIQMPKVELKGPQVDIMGPKMDGKSPKVEVSIPDVDVEIPSVQVDVQAPDAKLEGDVALPDKDVSTRDSKFKMPKFKMPSFGLSAPGKALDASLEVKAPKMEADVALPSIQGDLKASELSIQLPVTEMETGAVQLDVGIPEATLPEGESLEAPAPGLGLKGHVPKVHMPSAKMPTVDLKGSKVDVKGPKGELSAPALGMEMPFVHGKDTKLEGDLDLTDKDVSTRDSKFKMPKFKMPSFGVSAPGKALDPSIEVMMPKVEAEVVLPPIQGDRKSSDLSIQLPVADLGVRTGQAEVKISETTLPEGELPEDQTAGPSMKGHQKLQVPSIKMPKVELKGPQVDIKDHKVDMKGPKGEVSTPALDVEMPSVQVDMLATDAKLEGELALEEKDVVTKDSKFKMPKFRMPSFGVSAPAKALDESIEGKMPRAEADQALPSIQGDLKSSDLTMQLPSADLDASTVQVGVTLPEATMPEGELPDVPVAGARMEGHLPKLQMPSIKMPKVDLKGPSVDIKGPKVAGKGPKVEVSIPEVDKELPSLQVDIQAPDTKLEGDVALPDKDVSTRDSKFKMPKFKMPSFGLSAPSKALDASLEVKAPKMEADVALPSIQGDLKGSELSIQLPSTDMDAKTGQVGVTLPEATLPEGHLPEGPAAQTGLKGHLPKVQVPSITMPKVDLKGPQVHIKGPNLGMKCPKGEMSTPAVEVEMPSVQVDIQAPDAKLEGDVTLADKDVATRDSKFTTVDVDTPFPKEELELKFQRPHFKFSKFSLPHNKGGEDSAGLDEGSGVSLLSVSPRPSSESHCGESQEPSMSWAMSSMGVPSFATSDLPPVRFDGTADHTGDAVFPGSSDSTLNHTLGPFFSPGARAECPQPSSCSLQHDIPCSGSETSAVLQVGTVIPVFPPEYRLGPEDTLLPVLHARVTFPKFHKPKFGFSSATAVDAEADAPAADGGTGLSLLCPVEGVDSSGERAMVASLPASQPLSLGVPASPVTEEQLGPPLLGAPAEDADPDGKGSPFKMPRLKLPAFSWSPKKEAMATGDPGDHPEDSALSLVLDPDQVHTQRGVPISQTEAQTALPPEKEGEKARRRRPAIAMPRLSLPKLRASKGRESVPPGGVDAAFSSTTGGCDSEATEKARHADGGRDTGVKFSTLDGDGGPTQVPQSPGPSLGLAKPNLSASTVKVEVSLSEADLGLPTRDQAVRGDSRECGLGDTLVSQSHGERTAPTPPQDVPPAESAEEGTAAGESLAGGQKRWLRVASFHTPGGRRPCSRERGASWEQDAAESCMPAARAPAEAFSQPGSEETSVAPQSSEAETEATAPESESPADVPSRQLGRPGLRLHLPAAPMCASGPGGRTHPTEDFLPLQMPRVRPSERQAPPAKGCGEPPPRPGGGDLVKAEASTETWSLQPEGPLKLKASSTDLPSQVSVVSVDQLWEDSVLTVTFPKLKVPRFSFPESSSEADVFFPIVRDVPCVEAGAEAARLQESPGLWGASLLRAAGTSGPGERPEGPDLSLEAPPVSKVRVHIQESRGESQGITICSGVTGECAGLGAPEALSSQIVRESEIPASTVEMPSYGFSLLKAKIPEPPAQASTCALSQDLGAWEHPGGAPGGDAVPGGPWPDPGEPFEVISTSAGLPGPQACAREVCSGLQLADGGSDEEPAEILEFPSDSSLEASTQLAGEDRAPKEKLEGKKPSGLLWSWLPNIGFSSMDESSVEAGDDAGRSAPIQTQPGARSDPEPPKKQERAGWFRFPRLGFSSSPAKKSKGAEAEAGLAEQKLQEEAATFFDARESFSPEEEEDEVAAGAAGARLGSRVMVASSARTALTLLEHRSAGEEPVPRPVAE
ncbi:protein AHNAK2 [Sciurus carolinensis]|uniref:protein AHNAK2 n=1 Tax=Sciurus carolinensis TaxID=30640 RepID=UPI001FB31371|nr:protein AHNAK2 [Sciurus carolinensis]